MKAIIAAALAHTLVWFGGSDVSTQWLGATSTADTAVRVVQVGDPAVAIEAEAVAVPGSGRNHPGDRLDHRWVRSEDQRRRAARDRPLHG
jgi:hypothetical protein